MDQFTELKEVCIDVLVKPMHFSAIEKNIYEQIQELENKILCTNDVGYVQKIEKIISWKFVRISFPTHDGSCVFEVHFMAYCINCQPQKIYELNLKQKARVIYCFAGPVEVVVCLPTAHFNLKKKKQKTLVKITNRTYDLSTNKIQAVAQLFYKD